MIMIGVTSIDEILNQNKHGKYRVVGVFVANGYNEDAISWLQSAWENIHRDSGENWDLLVPVRGLGAPAMPRNIDVALGDDIREMYRLPREQTPCIIFDNFNGSARQKLVSLKGTEADRNSRLFDIVEFMKQQDQHEGGSKEWLAERIDDLYGFVRKKDVRRNAWHIAPHAFSLIAEAALKAFMH
jgi:hypothetical protein